MRPITAVLFDFAGTLLVPESREAWVAAACPELPPAEVAGLAEALERAGRSGGPEPEVLPAHWAEAYSQRDLSGAQHRALYEGLMGAVTGAGTERTRRLYDRGLDARGWVAYPDAAGVLQALGDRDIPVAVVSNAGFDLRPLFAGHGLASLVGAFVLSFEVGVMKPSREIFRRACETLGADPLDCLMVGDNPRADAAACDVGIRTLLLPYSRPGAPHGLAAVLDLMPKSRTKYGRRPAQPTGGDMPAEEHDTDAEHPDAAAIAEAMAVYSADGQADDATGGDAGAEALKTEQSTKADPDEDLQMPHGPS